MELRETLGEELFSQAEARLTEINGADDRKDNPVRFVDLSEGSYVGKEKYSRVQAESEESRQSAKDWEARYAEETKALQEKLSIQERVFAAERYLDGQKIKSPLSRKAILNEFMAQNLEFKDGKFIGADEYIKGVREKYPEEFQKDEEPKPKKIFVRGAGNTYKPVTKSEEEAYLKTKYGNNKYSK